MRNVLFENYVQEFSSRFFKEKEKVKARKSVNKQVSFKQKKE